jgi:hypothetical protein
MLWGLSQTRKGKSDSGHELGGNLPGRTTRCRLYLLLAVVSNVTGQHLRQGVYEPSACPECQASGCLVRYGVYWRKLRDGEHVYRIPIQRWLCKVCRRTVSALPDFLVRFRWYVVGVIQGVVAGREEGGASWAQMQAQAGAGPHVRTMQRWCKSFGGEAARWLGAVQTQLAQQDSASGWLDPQGEALRVGSAAGALLAAAVHLLAWGKSRWAELAGYGWNDRLRFLGLCSCAQDPRAEKAYAWLLALRLEDGAWPVSIASGNYGYIAGYRRLAHSRWGCRSNTTGALACLALHPTLCGGPEARRTLDLLLGRETHESFPLGFEVARLVGAEETRGFITYYARFDLAQILDLCCRVGATREDERVAEMVKFTQGLQGPYGLWEYARRPQASRWVTFDLLRSLSRLDQQADWLSFEPRTPFRPYPKKARRY